MNENQTTIFDQPEVITKKKKKPFKVIIILVAVMLILGLGIGALLLFGEEESPYDTNRVIEKVVTFDVEDVDKLFIQTTDESITLLKNEKGVWEFEKETTIEVSQASVTNYITLFTSVISNDSAGDAKDSNFSEFGLDPAETTVTLEFDDGKTMVCKTGSKSPYNNGTFYYCDAASKIYIIDTEETESMNAVKLQFYYLLLGDDEVVGEIDPNLSSSAYNLDYINIKASFYDYEIKIRKQTKEEQEQITSLSGYVLEEPYSHPISSAAMKDLYDFMKVIPAFNILTDDTREENIKICGLDKPLYEINYGWNGEKKRIRISEPIDDICYAYKDGGKYIYMMLAETADTFNKSAYEYCEDVAFLDIDLNDVSEFKVIVGEKEYPFMLSGDDLEMKVTLNGKEINTEYFKQYFVNVEGFMVKGEAMLLGDEEEMISIEVKYRNKDKTDKLSFYKIDEITGILTSNGEAKFAVDMNAIKNVIGDVEKLANGEKIDNIW
ncbi:MAG: DUF4340 domain-containing protein [Clostridia bacterium]|nr:DUF4340 domain-containing protein [Clostridia bacterium]